MNFSQSLLIVIDQSKRDHEKTRVGLAKAHAVAHQFGWQPEIIQLLLLQQSHDMKSMIELAQKKNAVAIAIFIDGQKSSEFHSPEKWINSLIYESPLPVLAFNTESTAFSKVRTILFASDFSEGAEYI